MAPLAGPTVCVQIVLTRTAAGQPLPRTLLADSGAGPRYSAVELILNETDCLQCGSPRGSLMILRSAYSGRFPVYDIALQLPALGFAQRLLAVGVPSVPVGFDGIACFRFLNRFTYGNFGDSSQFGLEC